MDMTYTSGKISHDPKPYVDQWGIERNEDGDPAGYDFDAQFCYKPRPEYDNHNPILVEFRRSAPWDVVRSARIAAEWLEPPAKPIPASASPEQIDHARRVLTMLAKLS